MRKAAYAVTVLAMALAVSGISFAQGPTEGQAGQQQGQGMRGGMSPMMMNGEMSVVDDGVIVLLGNRLYKYDKDLNLIKEVEIKIEKKTPPQQ